MRTGVIGVLTLAGLVTAHAANRPVIEMHAMADCAATGSVRLADGACMERGALVGPADFTGIGHLRFARGRDMLVVAMSDAGRRQFYNYALAHAGAAVVMVIDGHTTRMPAASDPLQPASLEIPGLTGAQIDALVLRFRGPVRK
jgi:hypothetical protein